MISDTVKQYGSITKILHWVLGIIMIAQVLLGVYSAYAPRDTVRQIMFWHKSLGLLLLLLAIVFIIWRTINPKPEYDNNMPIWEKLAARTIHFILYISILVMPLSGWYMSTAAGHIPSFFGLFSMPAPFMVQNKLIAHNFAQMHEIFAWVIGIAIVIHLLAAIKHHFIDKDDILKRML